MSTYISDPTIVPRVQEYLLTNAHQIYIDLNLLADRLQNKYSEYSKRKRSAFRASVNKAYSIVLQHHGVDTAQEYYEDEAVVSSLNSHKMLNNLMNDQLKDLYSSVVKGVEGNELIDISSDESEHAPSRPDKNTSTNGMSPFYPENGNVDGYPHSRKSGKRLNYRNEESVKKKKKLDQSFEAKAKKQTRKVVTAEVQSKVECNFKKIAGMNKTLEEVCKMILHIKHPEIYKSLGISPPRGLLLHGPPGCGKTLLANAIAGELDVPLIKVAAPELVAGVSGESEERIRELFAEATKAAPCVLFIDEIDAITPSRQNVQKDMEKRIVAQMLSCLDDLNENGDSVLVIGASNRLDSIDAALRRAGRFDKEISLGIPDVHSRSQILKNFCANLKLTENFDFDTLAGYTPGFVGADLLSLTREAAMVAVNRCFKELQNQRESKEGENQKDQPAEEQNNDSMEESNVSFNATKDAENTEREKDKSESTSARVTQHTTLEELLEWLHKDDTFSDSRLCDLCITMSDFEEALKHIQPSAKREGFATVPNTTWDDIGSLRDIREELEMAIVAPVRHAKEFSELGIDIPTGVLLCGPPGCGKTLLAKAIANEAGINFISVKGPELLNMYVGESEKAVRVCFERARNSAPCVIFFDELDALCPKRSDSGEGSACRVVNQMLTEMDGVEGRRGVYLLAASNRPDIIDPAVLRPGRLDKILFVGLPTAKDRAEILKAITKNGTVPKLAPDVNLEDIGKREQCEGYTGADLAALVREASIVALKEFMSSKGELTDPITVGSDHFKKAMSKIRPSISNQDKENYEKLRKNYLPVLEQIEGE